MCTAISGTACDVLERWYDLSRAAGKLDILFDKYVIFSTVYHIKIN
jgi:hypothetical protein